MAFRKGLALVITSALLAFPQVASAAPGDTFAEPGLPVSGCTYNPSPPTATSARVMTLRCDASGKLLTSGTTSGGGSGGVGTDATPNVSTIRDGASTNKLAVDSAGKLGVNSLPAITGNVGVTSLPALPTGSNAIGTVGVTALPALPAGGNAIGTVGVTSLPALSAGTNSIGSVVPTVGGSAVAAGNPLPVTGQVGGKTATPRVALTVTSGSAYTSGQVVGGITAFTTAFQTAGSGVLNSIVLDSKSVQTGSFRVYVFSSNPTASTFTDKTAPSLNVADIPKLVGAYALSAPDSGLGTHTIYNLDGISKAIAAGATTLYCVLVTNSTPTFASTSDLGLTIATLQD